MCTGHGHGHGHGDAIRKIITKSRSSEAHRSRHGRAGALGGVLSHSCHRRNLGGGLVCAAGGTFLVRMPVQLMSIPTIWRELSRWRGMAPPFGRLKGRQALWDDVNGARCGQHQRGVSSGDLRLFASFRSSSSGFGLSSFRISAAVSRLSSALRWSNLCLESRCRGHTRTYTGG